jgi:hypothetical protein
LTFAIASPIFIFMKGITRGFAKNERDEQKLRDRGITTIYRSDRGETLGKFRMRKGELLGVVNLRAFGSARKDMVAAVKQVHKWGAVVVDIDGLRSIKPWSSSSRLPSTPRKCSAGLCWRAPKAECLCGTRKASGAIPG